MNVPALSKTVATPSPAVMQDESVRRLPRALMGGTTAMRALGEWALPKEEGESKKGYEARLARTFLFNGYGKTVRDMASRVFERAVVVDDDVDAEIKPLLEDVDLAGRNLDVFLHAVFTDALGEGVSYILTDMLPPPAPSAPGRPPTRAETRDRRPWWVHIKAEQVLGWRSAYIDGREVLTQFRFLETVEQDEDAFAVTPIRQVRVFSRSAPETAGAAPLVTWQIWRKAEKADGWAVHDEGVVTIPEIPVVAVQTRRVAFFRGHPPLSDLAEVNLAHWQSQSDQRNILHFARVPLLFGAGIPETAKIEVSASRMIRATDPNAKLTWVEHSGQAIGSGERDLKALEQHMQTLGLRLLTPSPSGDTATGALLDDADANTPLGFMAKALEDSAEGALAHMALFLSKPREAGGTLTVNKDYGLGLKAAQDAVILQGAVDRKAITRATYLRELIRRGLVSDEVDPDAEVEAALEDGFDLPDDPPEDEDDDPGGDPPPGNPPGDDPSGTPDPNADA